MLYCQVYTSANLQPAICMNCFFQASRSSWTSFRFWTLRLFWFNWHREILSLSFHRQPPEHKARKNCILRFLWAFCCLNVNQKRDYISTNFLTCFRWLSMILARESKSKLMKKGKRPQTGKVIKPRSWEEWKSAIQWNC